MYEQNSKFYIRARVVNGSVLNVLLRATASMLSAHMLSQFRLSVRPSVCLSVCPSVRHTGDSCKNG